MIIQPEKKDNIIKSLISKSKLFFKSDFFQSKIVLWLMILSLLANIINWVILLIFVRPVDGGIILHYNVYFGVDEIGGSRQVFIMPSVGLILFIINSLLAGYFYRQKERIASYVLLMASLMAQMSLIIASISVIIINY